LGRKGKDKILSNCPPYQSVWPRRAASPPRNEELKKNQIKTKRRKNASWALQTPTAGLQGRFKEERD